MSWTNIKLWASRAVAAYRRWMAGTQSNTVLVRVTFHYENGDLVVKDVSYTYTEKRENLDIPSIPELNSKMETNNADA